MVNLRADALKEAKAHCDSAEKDLVVLKTVDAEPAYAPGNFPKTEVFFKCRKKDDKMKYL